MPYLMQSRFLQLNLFTVQSIICALLLPWFATLKSSGTHGGFFTLTSRLSYSLYLVHILVIVTINKALSYFGVFDTIYTNPFILYPLYFTFFYLVSWCTYHLIEKPFLDLRETHISYTSVVKASWVSVLTIVVLISFF